MGAGDTLAGIAAGGAAPGPGRAMAVSAARQSMGGQALPRDGRDPARTDILDEWFIPFDGWDRFLDLWRRVLPMGAREVLTAPLRIGKSDAGSRPARAPASRIAAILSFSREMPALAGAGMARMTRAQVDGAELARGREGTVTGVRLRGLAIETPRSAALTVLGRQNRGAGAASPSSRCRSLRRSDARPARMGGGTSMSTIPDARPSPSGGP